MQSEWRRLRELGDMKGKKEERRLSLSTADVVISTHSHDVICRGDLFARTEEGRKEVINVIITYCIYYTVGVVGPPIE